MAVFSQKLDLTTQKQFEIVDVTAKVLEAVKQSKVKNGLVSIFSPHTTAAIRINHFEPLLLQDIMKLMYRLAPLETNYAHDFFEIRTEVQANERSNGHAHVKAFLLGSSQTVPIVNQKMLLGFRQSIFFVEMDGPRERDFIVTVIGD
jgi:secondary thiamine-phosphate synthase enzyme